MSNKPPLPWVVPSKTKVKGKKGVTPLPADDQLVDDPLSALTRMAYPLSVEAPLGLKETFDVPFYEKKYRSKFFFRINPSIAQHVEMLKEQEARSRYSLEEPVNKHLEARAKTFSKEVAPTVDKRISKVREYFLTELSPLVMAAQGGVAQAREVFKTALETDVEQASVDQFDSMLRQGVQIKMARFVAKYLGLDQKDAETLMAKMATGKGGNDQLVAAINRAMSQAPDTPAGLSNPVGEMGRSAKPSRMERIREAGKRER